MNGGMTAFAIGVLGLAATAAMVAPPAPGAEEADNGAQQVAAPAGAPNIAIRDSRPPKRASSVGGMVSNSVSSPPMAVRMHMPPPPVVAIPRIPGPADMMVEHGDRELRTIRSFPSNEACDEALASVRRTISNAFCVSTTPPPPPPEHGYLVEVETATNEWVGLETYPSMAACERALAARPTRPGRQAVCTPSLH
jgi:hypothetical protein